MHCTVAAQSRSRPHLTLRIVYWLLFAAHLLTNKAVISFYPHASTVRLVQLASSCLLATLCGSVYHGHWKRGRLLQKLHEAMPSAGSALVAVLACLHGFKQGIDVDTWVALDTCTPVAVAAAEALMLSKAAVNISHSILVLAVAAAALSMQVLTISSTGIWCLLVGFVGTTLCIMHSFHEAKAKVIVNSTERVYVNSLVSLGVCFSLVMMHDRSAVLAVLGLSGPQLHLLALSCILAFLLSYISWEVQATSSTAVSYAAAGCTGRLISLIINYTVWDKHSSILATWLTATAATATMLWQNKPTAAKSSNKSQDLLQTPTSHAAGIVAVAGAVAGVALLSGTVGAAVVIREVNQRVIYNSNLGPRHEMPLLHHQRVLRREAAVQRSLESSARYAATADSLVVAAHDVRYQSSGSILARNSSSSSVQATSIAAESSAGSPAAQDSGYLGRLKAAAAKPINIVVMTGLFWSLNPLTTANCSIEGIPLDCHITQDQAGVNTADDLYYHIPSFTGRPRPKAFPDQLRLAMSLESAAYYGSLNDPDYMCGFDAEMTYRQCAQVVNWYSLEGFKNLFATPPVPFEDKKHAVVYINSNCAAASGRSEIMRQLMALNSSVPVHSLGRCDNNMPWPAGHPTKIDVQRRYKFCITMENSVSPDYVTEKLWDGLTAGCVPVYMGAASAVNMIPDRQGIILYDPEGKGHASTPKELAHLLQTIGSNKDQYEAMMQWKYKKPEDQPNPLFKYLWSVQHTTGECFLCQLLARHRADPRPRYTTCLFNKTWAAANGQQVVSRMNPDGPCLPV